MSDFMSGSALTGAVAAVFAALLPPGRSKYHGKMINRQKEVLDWEKMKIQYDIYMSMLASHL